MALLESITVFGQSGSGLGARLCQQWIVFGPTLPLAGLNPMNKLPHPMTAHHMQQLRSPGCDIFCDATKKLPTHHRIIHPDGAAGFNEANLTKLAEVFVNTTGH